ncbi:hypothetical protein AVEN_84111-1 [Araneus ventricosus]|uniref:Uncharacterized protein n=1 Tax=Araneus ventricosus TaxID=182803 RepID=A0A4Y2AKP6_ARAVE|nr:hypothetical protein AVEN_84111-1 [Araneus ventricosus]
MRKRGGRRKVSQHTLRCTQKTKSGLDRCRDRSKRTAHAQTETTMDDLKCYGTSDPCKNRVCHVKVPLRYSEKRTGMRKRMKQKYGALKILQGPSKYASIESLLPSGFTSYSEKCLRMRKHMYSTCACKRMAK